VLPRRIDRPRGARQSMARSARPARAAVPTTAITVPENEGLTHPAPTRVRTRQPPLLGGNSSRSLATAPAAACHKRLKSALDAPPRRSRRDRLRACQMG
jgi:hypothetical protein